MSRITKGNGPRYHHLFRTPRVRAHPAQLLPLGPRLCGRACKPLRTGSRPSVGLRVNRNTEQRLEMKWCQSPLLWLPSDLPLPWIRCLGQEEGAETVSSLPSTAFPRWCRFPKRLSLKHHTPQRTTGDS